MLYFLWPSLFFAFLGDRGEMWFSLQLQWLVFTGKDVNFKATLLLLVTNNYVNPEPKLNKML